MERVGKPGLLDATPALSAKEVMAATMAPLSVQRRGGGVRSSTLAKAQRRAASALLPVASILFVGAGILGAGTLKDLSLALFIGLATGTYSSIFIATPILATLREREPSMKALAKRVAQRGPQSPGEVVVISGVADTANIVTSTHSKENRERGPRNQPRRRSRR